MVQAFHTQQRRRATASHRLSLTFQISELLIGEFPNLAEVNIQFFDIFFRYNGEFRQFGGRGPRQGAWLQPCLAFHLLQNHFLRQSGFCDDFRPLAFARGFPTRNFFLSAFWLERAFTQ